MKAVDRAWMAATIEQRGKIHFTNDPNRKTNQLVLRISSKRLQVIDKLAALTGTKALTNEARTIAVDRRACTEHCDEAHVHTVAHIPETGLWAISGCGAAIVLDNLLPYFLDPAGIQALVDNIFAGLPKPGQGRAAVDSTIMRLRKLGWRINPAALEHFVGTPQRRNQKGRFEPALTSAKPAPAGPMSDSVGAVTDG